MALDRINCPIGIRPTFHVGACGCEYKSNNVMMYVHNRIYNKQHFSARQCNTVPGAPGLVDGIGIELDRISLVDDDCIEDRSASADALEEGGTTDVGLIQRLLSIKRLRRQHAYTYKITKLKLRALYKALEYGHTLCCLLKRFENGNSYMHMSKMQLYIQGYMQIYVHSEPLNYRDHP